MVHAIIWDKAIFGIFENIWDLCVWHFCCMAACGFRVFDFLTAHRPVGALHHQESLSVCYLHLQTIHQQFVFPMQFCEHTSELNRKGVYKNLIRI